MRSIHFSILTKKNNKTGRFLKSNLEIIYSVIHVYMENSPHNPFGVLPQIIISGNIVCDNNTSEYLYIRGDFV